MKKGDNDKASSHGGHHGNSKKHNEPDVRRLEEVRKALSDAKKEKQMVEQRMAKAQGYTEFKVSAKLMSPRISLGLSAADNASHG